MGLSWLLLVPATDSKCQSHHGDWKLSQNKHCFCIGKAHWQIAASNMTGLVLLKILTFVNLTTEKHTHVSLLLPDLKLDWEYL